MTSSLFVIVENELNMDMEHSSHNCMEKSHLPLIVT